jgi:VWFA-related protein
MPLLPTLPRCLRLSAILWSTAACLPAQQPAPIQIPLPPQSASPSPGPYTLRARSRTVLLDVVVTDPHGRPVRGLKPEDFRLLEDGKVQTIASLEEHTPQPPPDMTLRQPAVADLGPNTWSNVHTSQTPRDPGEASVVILLDSLNTPVDAQMYVRDQLLSYFRTMRAGTEVAIFTLDTQLRLLQGFTTDPAVLRTCIQERDKVGFPPISAPGYVGQAMRMGPLTDAMQSLGAYLATRPGRKNLIWFTANIPNTAYNDAGGLGGDLHDAESFAFDYSKATDGLVLGQVTIYPVDARGLQTDPAFSAANAGPPRRDSAQRFSERQFYQHSDLEAVAEATGGKAFVNTNGIKEAVREVVDTGSSFYTLSFYPTNKSWDGSFRKLQLDATVLAPNRLELLYRRGYYALAEAPATMPTAIASAPEPDPYGRVQLTHTTVDRAFANTMQLGAVDPNQILFKARVFVDAAIQKDAKLPKGQPVPSSEMLEPKFRDKPYRKAQVVYLVPGNQLQFTAAAQGGHEGKVEFVALVFDSQGVLVAGSSATLNMTLKPETFARVMKQGLLLPVNFRIPQKGSYFLRLGLHDLDNGHAGVLEVPASTLKVGPLAQHP